MKKIMMAAAIVCAAAVAQAATFTWQTAAKAYGPDATLDALVDGTHYGVGTTQLSALTTATWTFVMSLDNGTTTDDLSGNLAFSIGKVSVKNLTSDLIFKPESGQPINNVNYSIVITGTWQDAAGNDWTLTSDAITGTASFSSLSALTLTSPAPTGWTATGAPEPTSAMLLLLGMAGLALRRKQA